MSNSESEWVTKLVVVLLFVCIAAGWIGFSAGYQLCQDQAIKSNAGRWVLADETGRKGEVRWEWTGRTP